MKPGLVLPRIGPNDAVLSERIDEHMRLTAEYINGGLTAESLAPSTRLAVGAFAEPSSIFVLGTAYDAAHEVLASPTGNHIGILPAAGRLVSVTAMRKNLAFASTVPMSGSSTLSVYENGTARLSLTTKFQTKTLKLGTTVTPPSGQVTLGAVSFNGAGTGVFPIGGVYKYTISAIVPYQGETAQSLEGTFTIPAANDSVNIGFTPFAGAKAYRVSLTNAGGASGSEVRGEVYVTTTSPIRINGGPIGSSSYYTTAQPANGWQPYADRYITIMHPVDSNVTFAANSVIDCDCSTIMDDGTVGPSMSQFQLIFAMQHTA